MNGSRRCRRSRSVTCRAGPELRQRLFQPFASGGGTGDPRIGSGLGLAISHEIVLSLGGGIALDNRMDGEHVIGLDAVVRLPLNDNAA